MITKLLIANRGEIACRVISTAQRMGVATVAIYSDADANARHVEMADEAVRIGAAPVGESYLLGDRIIEAARKTGAQAIHPGYGFVSENPDFVEKVEAAGLIFVGPLASAIRAMGLKDAAKAAMEKAGVPVVPGYHGDRQDADFLTGEAEKIGYPVLIKARAGGGGKGMRLVQKPIDFVAALEGAQREAASSFGDPACLIEKYITSPRHVEVQVFGDAHGNVVHLFERDCSLQRRHQKVIEEAPAPGMSEEVRAAMGKAAVEAAKAIGYRGAGTVEFIAEGSKGLRADGFWFMEMNTRLQVEHPVSEAITGLDFVELQLRVANGEPLPFAQDDLAINGWAFEARLYAEDVQKGFLPATGTIAKMEVPDAAQFTIAPVRVDSGVREGDDISPYYDPMIAKLIVHGEDRDVALNRLSSALAQCRIAGLVTNLSFLGALSRNEGFAAGDVDTGLIERNFDALTETPSPEAITSAVAALKAAGFLEASGDMNDPWTSLKHWRQWTPATYDVTLEIGETELSQHITCLGPERYRVQNGEEAIELTAAPEGGSNVRIVSEGHEQTLHVMLHEQQIIVFAGHDSFEFMLPAAAGEEEQAAGDSVIAPMPGLVKQVKAKAGDTVEQGAALLVLEAMKMEHTLTAPRDGIIAELLADEGAQVANGALLVRLKAEDG